MSEFFEGISPDCDCGAKGNAMNVPLSTNTKNNDQIRIAKLETALFTLKGIAQGYGTDPRIYAQNTLDEIGESY